MIKKRIDVVYGKGVIPFQNLLQLKMLQLMGN